MGDATTRQSCEQMLNGGHLAGTQIQGGAELAVAHLIRGQPDRLGLIGEADLKSGLVAGDQANHRLLTAVKADAPALDLIAKGPGPAVVLRPDAH